MHAGDSPEIRALLLDEETAVVPDGISVVKAMRLLGCPPRNASREWIWRSSS